MAEEEKKSPAPVLRVVLRYLVGIALGALVTRGLIRAEDAEMIMGDPELLNLLTDPQMIELIGIGIGTSVAIAVEYWWRIAVKLGWPR
jgi:hypothetical protein